MANSRVFTRRDWHESLIRKGDIGGASPSCCGDQILTPGPDGNLWYAAKSSTGQFGTFANEICRFVIATATDTCFPSMAPPSVSVPSLISGPNNSIWYAFGGNGNGPDGITRMTTDGTIASRQLLPAGFAGPEGMTVGASPTNATSQGTGGLAVYIMEQLINRIAVVTSG